MFGRQLYAGKHRKAMTSTKVGDVFIIPEPVMIGEANRIQSGALGVFDEFVRGQLAVI